MTKYQRLIAGIGDDKYEFLTKKTVAIIGLGGVGGHACEVIARSGIKKIIIMDNDIVDISNFNRQLIALDSTIGQKKVEVMKKRITDIDKSIEVIALDEFYQSGSKLFDYSIDYLIDAIDSIPAKIDLINQCINRHIGFISVMGTAKKFDPSALKIMKIEKTTHDPIARILRKTFKDKTFMVVCSTEQPINCECLFSNAYVPSTAGILAASFIINNILKEE